MKWPPMPAVGVFGFFGLFYVVGFGILGVGLWNAYRATRAGAWPTTSGTISDVDLHSAGDGDGESVEILVRYVYEVDGVEYEGDRIAFGYCRTNALEWHNAILAKLQDARSVAVRYDPAQPSRSCLSFGLHQGIQGVLLFAVIWLAFTIGFTGLMSLRGRPDTVMLDNLVILKEAPPGR